MVTAADVLREEEECSVTRRRKNKRERRRGRTKKRVGIYPVLTYSCYQALPRYPLPHSSK